MIKWCIKLLESQKIITSTIQARHPLLKIHEVRKVDLITGVKLPAGLVTSLREGVAKRRDIFLAARYLKPLEKDYCNDLEDASSALRWLDLANEEPTTDDKKSLSCFTFDFKSLYDFL